MYRDFIVKQTSDFDSQFKPKTLVGNWYQQRCNPGQTQNFHFYKERKDPQNYDRPIMKQEGFQQSTSNWLNFQDYQPNKTFQTEYRNNYIQSNQQKRLSVLNPFVTKKS